MRRLEIIWNPEKYQKGPRITVTPERVTIKGGGDGTNAQELLNLGVRVALIATTNAPKDHPSMRGRLGARLQNNSKRISWYLNYTTQTLVVTENPRGE